MDSAFDLSRFVDGLPGEKREFTSRRVCIEILPNNAVKKVGTVLDHRQFAQLERFAIGRSTTCEICHSANDLEMQEQWHFADDLGVQSLECLATLCRKCAAAVRWDGGSKPAQARELQEHIRKLTGWNYTEFERNLVHAFAVSKARANMKWKADISILLEAGMEVKPLAPGEVSPFEIIGVQRQAPTIPMMQKRAALAPVSPDHGRHSGMWWLKNGNPPAASAAG